MKIYNPFAQQPEIPTSDLVNPDNNLSYDAYGYREAGLHQGGAEGFKAALKKLFYRYQTTREADATAQDSNRAARQAKRARMEEESVVFSDRKKQINEEVLPHIQNRISETQDEIRELRAHPERVQEHRTNKVEFWGSVILGTFLTMYLILFYSSAGYSAYFREITFDKGSILSTIFYANAFGEAWEKGIMAFLLILMFPSVFISMGYILHKLLETRKVIWAGALIVVTLFFDGVLAFEITKKVHDAIAMNSFTDMGEYTVALAFEDTNFWLIILSGFVVYIIWGVLLHFVMNMFAQRDKLHLELEKLNGKLSQLKEELNQRREEAIGCNEEINRRRIELTEVDDNSMLMWVDWSDFKRVVSAFTQGWVRYMSGLGATQSEMRMVNNLADEYYNELKRNNGDIELVHFNNSQAISSPNPDNE